MADADAASEVPPAVLAAGRGRGWTVLMPSAAAAEWKLVTVGGVEAAAGASAGSRSGGGGEVAIEMAALLAGSAAAGSGGVARPVAPDGGDGGSGGFGGLNMVPVIFIPNLDRKFISKYTVADEDKGVSIAKVIYGVLLFGSLGFINPVNSVLTAKGIENSAVWAAFGLCWALLSIGFHMSLYSGQNFMRRAYIQNIAHFSLIIFCWFIAYYLYLLLPESPGSLLWLIEMVVLLAVGHIGAWFWVVKTTAKAQVAGTPILPKGPSMCTRVEEGWTRITQGWWIRRKQAWGARMRQGRVREE